MANPIERAAEALATADRRLWSVAAEVDREQYRDFVLAVFESIDPDDLAGVLSEHSGLAAIPDEGSECECGDLIAGPEEYPYDKWQLHIAAAVKAWLTGKDQT